MLGTAAPVPVPTDQIDVPKEADLLILKSPVQVLASYPTDALVRESWTLLTLARKTSRRRAGSLATGLHETNSLGKVSLY